MIRFVTIPALAGLLALGLAAAPAHAAGTQGTSDSAGSTTKGTNPQHAEGTPTKSASGQAGMTKQRTGSGDTGYGDRAPDSVTDQYGQPGGRAQHR